MHIRPTDQPREKVIAEHAALHATAEPSQEDFRRAWRAPVHPQRDASREQGSAWKAFHSHNRERLCWVLAGLAAKMRVLHPVMAWASLARHWTKREL